MPGTGLPFANGIHPNQWLSDTRRVEPRRLPSRTTVKAITVKGLLRGRSDFAGPTGGGLAVLSRHVLSDLVPEAGQYGKVIR